MMKTRNSLVMICAALAAVLLSRPASATNLYVRVSGTNDTPPFTNWSLSCSNIQTVVNAAANGDIINVSNGTYYCWSNSVTSGMTNMITITKRLTIQSVNGPEVTIIDANYPLFSNRVFYIGADVTLSGLTITNGHTYDVAYGGGVYIAGGGGTPTGRGTLTNCWITGNSATNGVSDSYAGGGGVYSYGTGIIVNCRIWGNRANGSMPGGGLLAGNVRPCVIRDCVISNNSTFGLYFYNTPNQCLISNCTIVNNGRGVYNVSSVFIMDNCRINNNGPGWDGAGVVVSPGMVKNCQINNNVGTHYGGGVYMQSAILSNCIVSGNYSTNSSDVTGGGIHMLGGSMVLNCTIASNYADGGMRGGGIGIGSGTICNCLIASNACASISGGIYMDGSTSRIDNCTIVKNKGISGGGIYVNSGTSIVCNTIIISNTSGNWQGAVICTNCCTRPTNSLSGSGNITNNPAFVDYAGFNCRLAQDSPCINGGLNQNWMDSAADLDGHRRLDRYSRIVDMGCYEYLFSGMMVTIP
jgi:parallel beta-helix repeat protein